MTEYKIKEYKESSDGQRKYWNAAIGLQAVDGLNPSEYLYELSEQNIEGKISTQDIKEKLATYYKNVSYKEQAETMECDIVSTH